MKATLTLQAPNETRQLSVKKLLTSAVILLTSTKFLIFASVIAIVLCGCGNLLDDMCMVGWGGIIYLAGFTPWAWRETARELRRPERHV